MDNNDTETGGIEAEGGKKTSVAREPFILPEQYAKYIKSSQKEIVQLKKLLSEFKGLEQRADLIELKFGLLETRTDKTNSFMKWMSGIIVGVFFVTGVIIIVDYAKNKGDGYKNFIDKVENLKQDYYSKSQIDNVLKSYHKIN